MCVLQFDIPSIYQFASVSCECRCDHELPPPGEALYHGTFLSLGRQHTQGTQHRTALVGLSGFRCLFAGRWFPIIKIAVPKDQHQRLPQSAMLSTAVVT